MILVGLDVGFSATRASSGVARLAFGELSVGCATASLESRKKFFGSDEVDVAAIDAPILPGESYDQRVCERLFTLGCFQRRCKPGLSHVSGTGRAFRQAGYEGARQLSEITSGRELLLKFPRIWQARNLVEAFPNAFMGVLLPAGCFLLTSACACWFPSSICKKSLTVGRRSSFECRAGLQAISAFV